MHLRNDVSKTGCSVTTKKLSMSWSSTWSTIVKVYQGLVISLTFLLRSGKPQKQTTHRIAKESCKSWVVAKRNWTAPGPDGVHKFWQKKLSVIIHDPCTLPVFVIRSRNTAGPSEYRPITCLSSLNTNITAKISAVKSIWLNIAFMKLLKLYKVAVSYWISDGKMCYALLERFGFDGGCFRVIHSIHFEFAFQCTFWAEWSN